MSRRARSKAAAGPLFLQTDLISVFGRRGSGKSTLCKLIQRAFPRLIIVDLLREYEINAGCQGDFEAETFEDFDRILAQITREKLERFRVLFRFDIESSEDEAAVFDRLARLVYYFGNVVFVVEEIHHYMKREQLPEWLKKLILVGRHRRVGILATSQRPAEVSKTFVSQCHHVFCGTLSEPNDIKYFAAMMGELAEQLPSIKPFHFLHYRPGSPPAIVRNS